MRRLILAGTLGVAGVLASGVPAHAASDGTAPVHVQADTCWQKVSARISIKKSSSKKWRNVKAQVWVADPKRCKGKTITIWLAYKAPKKDQWFKAQKPISVKVVTSRKLYEAGAAAYSFPCGKYVRTEYRLGGVTWAGKSHKVC
jgi:hypothetical protein